MKKYMPLFLPLLLLLLSLYLFTSCNYSSNDILYEPTNNDPPVKQGDGQPYDSTGDIKYVAVGELGNNIAVVSVDGEKWWPVKGTATMKQATGVAYGNNIFAIVKGGAPPDESNNIKISRFFATSTDGREWKYMKNSNFVQEAKIRFYDGKFMTTIHQRRGINILDGTTQKVVRDDENNSWHTHIDLAYDGDKFVQVGGQKYAIVTFSGGNYGYKGGVITNSDFLKAVIYANSKFVTVGKPGTIVTSDGVRTPQNLLTWKKQTSGSSEDLNEIVYGDGKFVVVGNAGTILTSTDGSSWNKVSSGTVTGDLTGITYGGSKFVAVSKVGKIFTSPHGSTWTNRYSGAGFEFKGVAARP